MRVAYVEMIGGASGNMLLGALIDAGADPDAIERALRTIPVRGWTFERPRVVKPGSPQRTSISTSRAKTAGPAR